MNKQAITFLSLFTLILMLSIYYILLPPLDETIVVNTEEGIVEEGVDMDALQSDLNKRQEEEVASLNAIIASSDSSMEEISLALESIDMINIEKELEKNIASEVKTLGYEEVFIEVDQKVVKVTIKEETSNSSEVMKVMNTVYRCVDQNYLVEVKFIV